jgi:hypothetical protein
MATPPNPYDQFDAANPYDQFDAPVRAIAPQTQYEITTPYDTQLGATSPVDAEIKQGLGNMAIGAGKFVTDAGLRLRQLYNAITGGPSLDSEIAAKRSTDAPISNTYGGMIGEGAVPAALAPVVAGPSIAGAALYGGVVGALQPTTANDQFGSLGATALNTGVGAVTSAGLTAAGRGIANWAVGRAEQPFMGWTPASANRVAAQSVGSDAPNLNQAALAETSSRLGGIFNAARDPGVIVPMTGETAQAISTAAKPLNASSLSAFQNNGSVQDLMSLMRNGRATAQQLGEISSTLGADANTQMTSQMGDRATGRSLFQLKEHVDDMIGNSITDPDLANAYQEARGQYRNLSNLTANSSILNSATGDVNMTALAKRLQRTDKPGYLRGGNDSDLYEAARWGQATGQGKGAPPLELASNFGLPWLKYQAVNSAPARALGGAASRVAAPIAPAIPYGLGALGSGAIPVALPYLEN